MILVDEYSNRLKHIDRCIVDITALNQHNTYSKLSPIYPHGGIPVPNTPETYFNSVYEVWSRLAINSNYIDLKDKRFRKGLNVTEYWEYYEARKHILIPLYCWMLENKAFELIEHLRKLSIHREITIIDITTNNDIYDYHKPLSCGFLLKAYIEGGVPYQDVKKEITECKYVMAGHKEGFIRTKRVVFQKIASICTGAHLFDFDE